MKRILVSAVIVLTGIIISNGCCCHRQNPVSVIVIPEATNTPVKINTATAIMTSIPSRTKTPACTATGTQPDTPVNTCTNTITAVPSGTSTTYVAACCTGSATQQNTPTRTITYACNCVTGTQTPTSTLTPAPQGYLSWYCPGTGPTPVNTPLGIAIDNSNNGVYVTEFFHPSAGTINDIVQEYDLNGNPVTQWGSYGSGNGQFNCYVGFGIAVDNTGAYIYVADSGNNRIQKFDSSGNYISQWGTLGSGNGQFNAPNGVAVDSSGTVYVSDTGNSRIQKFDSNENYITQWGTSGSGNGQFNFFGGGGSAGGIAVYNAGAVLYVADTGNQRIQKFSLAGNYITQWGSLGPGMGNFTCPAELR